MLLEGAALLVTVVAIALWVEPLGRALGMDLVGRALAVALPLTLACQWALRARHLGRPSGLAGLARRPWAVGGAAALIALVPAMAFGAVGAVAGLLTVTWTGGSILLRRGWALPYALIVASAAPAMLAGAPAVEVIVAVTALTTGAAILALRRHGAPGPARSCRAAGAGRSAPG